VLRLARSAAALIFSEAGGCCCYCSRLYGGSKTVDAESACGRARAKSHASQQSGSPRNARCMMSSSPNNGAGLMWGARVSRGFQRLIYATGKRRMNGSDKLEEKRYRGDPYLVAHRLAAICGVIARPGPLGAPSQVPGPQGEARGVKTSVADKVCKLCVGLKAKTASIRRLPAPWAERR
jgi:hypothetical protein